MGNWGYNPTRQFGGSFFFCQEIQQYNKQLFEIFQQFAWAVAVTRPQDEANLWAFTWWQLPDTPKKKRRELLFSGTVWLSLSYMTSHWLQKLFFLPELYMAHSLPTCPNTKCLECPGELERLMWRCLQVRGVIPADIKIVDFHADFLCTKCWFPKKHICSPLLGEMIQFEYIIFFEWVLQLPTFVVVNTLTAFQSHPIICCFSCEFGPFFMPPSPQGAYV